MAKKAANPGLLVLRAAKVAGKLAKDPRVRSKTKQVWDKMRPSKGSLQKAITKPTYSADVVKGMTATGATAGFIAGKQGGQNSTDNMNKGELDKKIGGK